MHCVKDSKQTRKEKYEKSLRPPLIRESLSRLAENKNTGSGSIPPPPTQKQYVIDKKLLPFFEKTPVSQIEPAEKRFSKRYDTYKGTLSGNFSHRSMCENSKTASYLTGTKTASPILKLTLEPKPTSYPLL